MLKNDQHPPAIRPHKIFATMKRKLPRLPRHTFMCSYKKIGQSVYIIGLDYMGYSSFSIPKYFGITDYREIHSSETCVEILDPMFDSSHGPET